MKDPNRVRPATATGAEVAGATDDERPEIVLIHGWGVNRKIWQTLLPELSRFFQVKLLDIAGFAPNGQYPPELSMENAVADLLRQAPKKAIWVGWSLGGTLAIKAALAQPHRIEQLILIGATPKFLASDDWKWGMEPNALSKLLELFQKDLLKGLKRFLLLQTSNRQIVADRIAAMQEFQLPDWSTLNQTIKWLTDVDLRDEIPRIKVPVASLVGIDDRIVSPQASVTLQKLVSAKLRIEPSVELSVESRDKDKQPLLFDSLPTAESFNEVFFFTGGHLFFLESTERFVAVLREIAGRRWS